MINLLYVSNIFIAFLVSFGINFQEYPKTEKELLKTILFEDRLQYDSSLKVKEIKTKDGYYSHYQVDSFKLRFIQKEVAKKEVTYLEINNHLVNLHQIYLWRTKNYSDENVSWNGAIGELCDMYIENHTIKKFTLNQHSYLSFQTGISNCNGSMCVYDFYFLYEFHSKKLYAFVTFKGELYFSDVNNDGNIDLLQTNPFYEEAGVNAIPIGKKLYAYTQDKNGTFRPIQDSAKKNYEIRYNFLKNSKGHYSDRIKVKKWYWF